MDICHSGIEITKKALEELRNTAELIFDHAFEGNNRLTELLIINEEKETEEMHNADPVHEAEHRAITYSEIL